MIVSYLLASTFVPVLCVALLRHMEHGDENAGLFGRILRVYGKTVTLARPPALGRGAGVSGGVCPGALATGLAGRHRVVPPGRFGAVRAPVPAAARLELRVDPRRWR